MLDSWLAQEKEEEEGGVGAKGHNWSHDHFTVREGNESLFSYDTRGPELVINAILKIMSEGAMASFLAAMN